jgi:hypothetical protein
MTKLSRLLAIPTLAAALFVPAHAATPTSGDLFFTTFQNQSGDPFYHTFTTNVWKVSFTFDGTTFTLGAPVAIKTLTGADGLIFDPNDATNSTLLIGEQNSNRVARLSTDGTTLLEVHADGTQPFGFQKGQAYGIAVTPDKSKVIVLPNDPFPNPTNINVLPYFSDGTTHTISGAAGPLRGMDFRQGVAFWGDAPDQSAGKFGTIDLSTYITSLVTIVDDTGGGAGQGALPSHGVTYDSFSDCFMLSSSNQIWQLCLNSGAYHIVAKITTPAATNQNPVTNPGYAFDNWDQISVDGKGHLFAANNDGDLLFIDYSSSATKRIDDGTNKKSQQFLAADLDDIVNGGGAIVPGGCPATKGFWHDPSLHPWPSTSITVGGVSYDGTTHSMTIGGTTYTQAQLLTIMPTGGNAGVGNGFVIGGSQLVAAVLNIANGAAHSGTVDAAIAQMNTLLTGQNLLGPTPSNPLNNQLKTLGGILDAYNSSASSLNCPEGTPGG